MKTILEVCMYSGAVQWEPRCEISEEELEIICDKVSKLHRLAGPKTRFNPLGTDSFTIITGIKNWNENGFEIIENYMEVMAELGLPQIYVLPNRVSLYAWGGENKEYEDTENLHSFLSELATPAIQAHYQRSFAAQPNFDWLKL